MSKKEIITKDPGIGNNKEYRSGKKAYLEMNPIQEPILVIDPEKELENYIRIQNEKREAE